MKLRFLSLFIGCIMATPSVFACDGCNLYAYSNIQNKTFLAMLYRHRLFNGYRSFNHNHVFSLKSSTFNNARTNHVGGENFNIIASDKDIERYQTYEIRLNYNVADKYNFQLILPYQRTTIYYKTIFAPSMPITDTTLHVNGPGDAMIFAERYKEWLSRRLSQMIKGGVGIKFPTGKYRINWSSNQLFHPQLQPGSGSLDVMFRGSYQAIFRKTTGFAGFASYRLNTATRIETNSSTAYKYKFGNRLNLEAYFFAIASFGPLKFIPKSGVFYEKAEKDTRDDLFEIGTGGKTVFWTLGNNVSFKNWIIQTEFQLPVHDRLNDNQIGNSGRLVMGFLYNF